MIQIQQIFSMIFCNISIPVDEIFDDKDYLYFELDQQE
jgi:hypothetical protein